MLTVAIPSAALPLSPGWESTRYTPHLMEYEDLGQEQIEVAVKDQYVYVYTQREVTLRIFSILGQLITQENLSPGSVRFRLPTRGIYILKVGSTTRRITI